MSFPVNPNTGDIHQIDGIIWQFRTDGRWHADAPGASYVGNLPANYEPPMERANSLFVSERGINVGDTPNSKGAANYIPKGPEALHYIEVNSGHGTACGTNMNQFDYVETYVQWHNIDGDSRLFLVFEDTSGHNLTGTELEGQSIRRGDSYGSVLDVRDTAGAGFHYLTHSIEPLWNACMHIRMACPNGGDAGNSYKKVGAVIMAFHNQKKCVYWNHYSLKTSVPIRRYRIAGYSGANNWFRGMTMGWRERFG